MAMPESMERAPWNSQLFTNRMQHFSPDVIRQVGRAVFVSKEQSCSVRMPALAIVRQHCQQSFWYGQIATARLGLGCFQLSGPCTLPNLQNGAGKIHVGPCKPERLTGTQSKICHQGETDIERLGCSVNQALRLVRSKTTDFRSEERRVG